MDDGLDEPVDPFDAASFTAQTEDRERPATGSTARAQLPRRPLGEEIEHAKRLFESASNEMKVVFQQARMGRKSRVGHQHDAAGEEHCRVR